MTFLSDKKCKNNMVILNEDNEAVKDPNKIVDIFL